MSEATAHPQGEVRWPQTLRIQFTDVTWLLLATGITCLAMLHAAGPIFDIDSYWHVLMGRDIWAHHRLSGNPSWSVHHNPHWQTGQWLSELGMAGLVHIAGWAGLAYMRIACTIATLLVLARTSYQSGNLKATCWVYSCVAAACVFDLQDRPASLSFILIPLLGVWALRALRANTLPSWWKPVALTAVWANFHGYWLLVPLVFLSVAVANLFHAVPPRRSADLRPALMAAACGVAAMANPGTYRVWTSLWAIHQAAALFIDEWAVTSLRIGSPVAATVLFGLVFAAWARRDRPVARPETVFMLGWVVFSLLAFRNVTVSMLLLAPLASTHIAEALPESLGGPSRRLRHGAAWVTLIAAMVSVGVAATTTRQPPWTPTALYRALAAEPGHKTVLNEYNIGGQILAYTEGRDSVTVDGRTDFYGRDYLAAWKNLINTGPGWRHTLTELRPTDAIISSNSTLYRALRAAGWTITAHDKGLALLRRPPASGR